MKDDNQMTDEMLVRYILGEASLQERLSVQEWLNVSRENKNRLDELTLIWKESGKLAATTSITTEEAWERFKGHISKTTHDRGRQVRVFHWLKVAAVLLLLAGGGWLSWVNIQKTDVGSEPIASTQAAPGSSTNESSTLAATVAAPPASAPDTEVISKKETTVAIAQRKKEIGGGQRKLIANDLHKNTRTKEFICNGTPCPLEICIVQTIRCSDGQPASVATCNLLQPDQSGQLHYKAIDQNLGNCHATVSEIRIKRVTTGETIVLNNNSKPSTAEELFNYLTGNCTTNGDILAGIFETDCDNSCSQNKLKIGTNFGHLILE